MLREHLEFEGHPPQDWDIIHHPSSVAIIPITQKGNLLLVQQWRRAIKKIIYELPAGTLDEGEHPLVCAQRELQEEIGHKAKELLPFGGFYSTPGFCNEYVHLFIGRNLEKNPLSGDAHEAIDVVEMPLEKALHLIDTEIIMDAKTIAGILRYERWKNHG